MAKAAKAPLLAQLPIDPQLAKLCDEGNIERYRDDVIDGLGESFSKVVSSEAGFGRKSE